MARRPYRQSVGIHLQSEKKRERRITNFLFNFTGRRMKSSGARQGVSDTANERLQLDAN
jgi:hypothetical protein